MAKLRKRYNWKSRQVVNTICDNSETNKIAVDLDVKTDHYDVSNALVLPSKKRAVTKVKTEEDKKVRLLSKRQRKKLEKILAVKKRKQNRAEILESLQRVQASEEEMKLMTSVTTMQTKGLKRCFVESKTSSSGLIVTELNSLKGMRKLPLKKARIQLGNVVGFNEVSSSDCESSDNEENSNTIPDCNDSEKIAEEQKAELTVHVPVLEKIAEVKVQSTITEKITDVTDSNAESTVTAKPENPTSTLANTEQLENKSGVAVCRTPVVHVPVRRDPAVEKARLALPILPEEQQVMETIRENPVVVICGETGSGKTTQVPQFLYEAGYAREGKQIGITEPRRIAAVSMSQRVSTEMNLSTKTVSYQIRFEGNVTDQTEIKFMTDGVLLKEIQKDFLLSRYHVIIIDEAHERSMYSDILIGLLSRIVPLRQKNGKPLKLIIMSATLRVEDFTQNAKLFKNPPPVINIDSRQYPVTIHFNKRTPGDDYLSEAYKKVCKIHRQLPEGGILVFVTGVQEVNGLCRKLRNSFTQLHKKKVVKLNACRSSDEKIPNDTENELDDVKALKLQHKQCRKEKLNSRDYVLPQINLDDYSVDPIDEELLREQNANVEADDLDEGSDDDLAAINDHFSEPLHVLPLYSMLPSDRQSKIFETPPDGSRLCVVATNVAETSLTIPNIKYVVDTGKVKVRMYDKVTGVSAFVVTWTSKASANQRAGRAGRTGPGHCYRLYSSSVFVDQCPTFSEPEITRRPIDDLVLQMKSMGIDKVVNFPFPTPPSEEALKAAENRLKLLGALEEKHQSLKMRDIRRNEWNSKITTLGQAMACFPISPRYAKMLALSHQYELLPYMVAIVSALTVQEVFYDSHLSDELPKAKSNKWSEIKKLWAGQGSSLHLGDVMVLLKAVGASEFNGCTPKFCEVHGLRLKALKEIRKLRWQLTNEVNLAIPNINLCVDPKMTPPTDIQCKLLQQLVLTGMIDHVARKVPAAELVGEEKSTKKNAYQCLELESYVYVHPQSVLLKENCEFLIYQEIVETSKLYMRIVTAIESEWLAIYAPSLCNFSKPLYEPKPCYDKDQDKLLCHVNATFGRWAWPLPTVEMEFPEGLEKYRWFACCFLEGEVCHFLKKYRKVLISPPTTVLKTWSKLHQPTENLLSALVDPCISSKAKLDSHWKTNPKYLLAEYRLWLPEVVHFEVGKKWPPV